MSRRPVLEEVDDDDIDNMDMDLAQFDPSLNTPIAPLRAQPTVTRSQDSEPSLFPNIPVPSAKPPATSPGGIASDAIRDPKSFTDEEKREFKAYQTIYPCYFDKNRSHKQGRRVSEENAVENPLALTIGDACRFLQFPVLLELDRTHPRDFGNPGRVKVLLRKNGEPIDEFVKNKRQVLNAIGKYLKTHPTTLNSVSASSGHPIPEEYMVGFTPEKIPKVRGFKMNTIVPVHSPFTMKHPMTQGIYAPRPEAPAIAAAPKAPKKKIKKIRA
ncbi:signal recognition particle subunit [Yamadazyma tenuis]|uniref:Signal recognition particle SEC65 subunit n=1 Tax=Candida tenuis (strain ATCC 10573 / BCRC 21748 / CBS 615 / JCM 9827 / NBRC 10315 / NRRL Y-1498 / VKM Y-70) TaxID=590646 RepID=G3BCG2_CANTC|nr:uncharacterized protein CANTEDRAFT_111483 [Yamadazyma tenuis ATCC 10573]EGV60829.1 hypothetical protein CANTEDRAFT_111483 [Yamadazyma tenuis ATCC 10573]WEJ93901.1 signal recognition particle subunit [Yamadazyma tenuis]